MYNLENIIIYLIGFRGTGKYTIAKELQSLINAKLVDNHTINNPIFMLHNVSEGISEEVWSDISKIRNIVLRHIQNYTSEDDCFIFTNELFAEEQEDIDLYNEILALASARKADFFPVILHCDEEQILKRIISEERKDKFKDTSIVNLKNLYDSYTLFTPDCSTRIEVDVTKMSAKESARNILEHIKNYFS